MVGGANFGAFRVRGSRRVVSYTPVVASIAAVEHRVNELQEALLELARQNDRTARSVDRLSAQTERTTLGLDRLSGEMREFKDEMREFKDETRKANADLRALLDKQNAEFNASLDRRSAELNASLDKQSAELNASLDKQNATLNAALNRQNAELSDALGSLAENVIGPSIPTLFKRFFQGEEPEFAMRIMRRHKVSRERREFDTPAWNDKVFLFCETKSKLRPSDLDMLSESIAEVRNFFPEADGKKVCAALASLYIDPTLVTAGERRGFLMIALGNNLAEVMNSEGFKPGEF